MPLTSETFEGTPDGMNLAVPQQELKDTEARYIQDGLLDFPGITRRRGPISAVGGLAAFAKKASGLVSTLNPLGQLILGALTGDTGTGNFGVLSTDFATKTDLTWPFFLPSGPPTNPYYYVDAKAGISGGTFIGVSSAYDSNSPTQGLAYWRGGNKANYTTGTITVARGSSSVVGVGTLWAANASPGMFLFANTDDPYTNAYIGTVLSVNSNTSITLGTTSPFPITAKAYTLQSLRGFCPRVVKGRITSDTASATVTGAVTKFVDQGLNTGTWQIHRASDFVFVGKVSAVTNNISLTLTANATVSTNNERFIAIRVDGDFNIINTANVNKVGFLNATYANRQWFANLGAQFEKTSRVWFSDPVDGEAVDLSTFDGDFIPITSTSQMNLPIKAIVPAYNALLVFKENETFAIYGNSPTTFNVKKLEDDGVISGMTAQPYGGGVVWAGRDGIHFYDGVETTNIVVDKLGDYYKSSIRTFDPLHYRAYAMVAREHYFLFVESITPTIPVVKGNTSSTPTAYTIVINMVTRAISILTNVNVRGAIELPADSGQRTWYLVNDSTKAVIGNSDMLFDSTGADEFGCDGGAVGPDFFFESKKYAAADSLRKKYFKECKIHYLVQGDSLKIDSVLGLNNIGTLNAKRLPNSDTTWDILKLGTTTWDAVKAQFSTWDAIVLSIFLPIRIKFMHRSTHFSFRIYQNSTAVTRVVLGPYSISYKQLREERL